MSGIRVGNAPCSWGALEFDGFGGEPIGYQRVLDEIAATGYEGTELGDWGLMPTDPQVLGAELARRRLAVVGAFLPVALKEPAAHADGEARALRVARLLATFSGELGGPRPWIILADDNGTDPTRTALAGRITAAQELRPSEWRTFAAGAERIARTVRIATGLRTLFHPHCAGYVETPRETERLLELTDPDLLGLVLDTGHCLYGSGQDDSAVVLDSLERFGPRLAHVHYKDCDPAVAEQARLAGCDYFEAVRRGVFCELGRGLVDFPAVTAWLRRRRYNGWIVVEQDVLPGMGAPAESARRNRDYLTGLGL